MLLRRPSLETGGALGLELWDQARAKLWSWPTESPEVPVLGMAPSQLAPGGLEAEEAGRKKHGESWSFWPEGGSRTPSGNARLLGLPSALAASYQGG